jgi:hypothetical protein
MRHPNARGDDHLFGRASQESLDFRDRVLDLTTTFN